jgi:hypothetical protein
MAMSSLPDDLRAIAEGAPPNVDWPRAVGAAVRARRRRQAALAAVTAVAVAATGTVAVVRTAAKDTSRLVVADPLPGTTQVSSPDPRPSASASVRVVPSPTGAASPGPQPTAAAASAGQSAPQQQPAPAESPVYVSSRNAIRIEIDVVPARPRVGEQVTITVTAYGDKDRPFFTAFSWDRGRQRHTYPIAGCLPAEPAPPRPGRSQDVATFVYGQSGLDTIEVAAESMCSFYPGSARDSLQITVEPAPTPSPTPSPTPTPSP